MTQEEFYSLIPGQMLETQHGEIWYVCGNQNGVLSVNRGALGLYHLREPDATLHVVGGLLEKLRWEARVQALRDTGQQIKFSFDSGDLRCDLCYFRIVMPPFFTLRSYLRELKPKTSGVRCPHLRLLVEPTEDILAIEELLLLTGPGGETP